MSAVCLHFSAICLLFPTDFHLLVFDLSRGSKNKTEIEFEIFDCEVDRGHELLILSYQEKRKQKFKMFNFITKSVEINFGSYLVLGHLDITLFENHRKSLIQHCERSELRLHFEWTNVY